ncbi:primosomal protein N' [Azotosporobacter soli]|uniref:primosomal protein N' n=1 Tax=Azotosporobacter soli TaxID=3055040 RepID=UPI0031FE86B5
MFRVAEVLLNINTRSLSKPFSYLIPDDAALVSDGWRVIVPVQNRMCEGFVVAVREAEATEAEKLREIAEVPDDEAWFDVNMLHTARWMSEYYLCSLTEAMRLFIPGKTGFKRELYYRLSDSAPSLFPDASDELLAALRSTAFVPAAKLRARFGTGVLDILAQWQRKGWLDVQRGGSNRLHAKYQNWLVRIGESETIVAYRENAKRAPVRQRLIDRLLQQPEIALAQLREEGFDTVQCRRLVEDGIAKLESRQIMRDSYAAQETQCQNFPPTLEQQVVLNAVEAGLEKRAHESFLLHGITGSGKTQVYILAALAARRQERQVIVLVPEIALTGQMVARFRDCFGDDVAVIHSKLSAGERFDAWKRLRQGQAGIAIGARSALFAPLTDIGLVIIDEEHEFSYKQEEAPRYHARKVAEARASEAGAVLLLGSATPSLESYHSALADQQRLLVMKERVDGAALPSVALVDMRAELKAGRRSVISQALRELLEEALAAGEQAILLLNRRGHSTFVLCRECGHVMTCEKCDVSLVYHQTSKRLQCHYCQANHATPDVCPACGSRYIRFFGTGTQKLEEELHKLLPTARVVRMDQDTTGAKFSHDRILKAFASGEYDILLGTQMVAKGHDIKNVTAVGILAADSVLNLPDFRAAERVFSLVAQASGRAGRGEKPGRVVVQTYQPEHYALQAGALQSYEAFYQQEIEHRQALKYPPCSEMVKFMLSGEKEEAVARLANDFAAAVRSLPGMLDGQLLGPFPAALYRVNNRFRMQVLLKGSELGRWKAALQSLLLERFPAVAVDVDPLNLL